MNQKSDEIPYIDFKKIINPIIKKQNPANGDAIKRGWCIYSLIVPIRNDKISDLFIKMIKIKFSLLMILFAFSFPLRI